MTVLMALTAVVTTDLMALNTVLNTLSHPLMIGTIRFMMSAKTTSMTVLTAFTPTLTTLEIAFHTVDMMFFMPFHAVETPAVIALHTPDIVEAIEPNTDEAVVLMAFQMPMTPFLNPSLVFHKYVNAATSAPITPMTIVTGPPMAAIPSLMSANTPDTLLIIESAVKIPFSAVTTAPITPITALAALSAARATAMPPITLASSPIVALFDDIHFPNFSRLGMSVFSMNFPTCSKAGFSTFESAAENWSIFGFASFLNHAENRSNFGRTLVVIQVAMSPSLLLNSAITGRRRCPTATFSAPKFISAFLIFPESVLAIAWFMSPTLFLIISASIAARWYSFPVLSTFS